MVEAVRGSATALSVSVYLVAATMAALVIGACSSSDSVSAEISGPSQPSTAADSKGSATDLPGLIPGAGGGEEEAEVDPDTSIAPDTSIDSAEPARRVPSQVSSQTSHWLGVNTMTDQAIELVWSEVEGDDVVYQIFRFDSENSPNPAEVKLETPLAEVVGELSLLDDNVSTGQFYSYVMRVIADDQVLERRWTQALAVTDTTAPTPIVGLTAKQTTAGVLLGWDPSSDNVEFGSYGVFRLDQGSAEPQYIGGGGDQAMTAFIDDEVQAGQTIAYEVVAFDFHGNRSAPASIEVTVN